VFVTRLPGHSSGANGFPVRFAGGVCAVTEADSIETDATASLDTEIAGSAVEIAEGEDASGATTVSLEMVVTDGTSVEAGSAVTGSAVTGSAVIGSVISPLDVSARAAGSEDRATVTLGSCVTDEPSVRVFTSALGSCGGAAVTALSVSDCTLDGC
jgi:hypothetical protein